jgi:hypothetical protein
MKDKRLANMIDPNAMPFDADLCGFRVVHVPLRHLTDTDADTEHVCFWGLSGHP